MEARIAVDPRVHFGKPCVAGTRIPVRSVLELVREGVPFAKIVTDYYPDLEEDDVRACIQYAMDVLSAEDANLAQAPRTSSATGAPSEPPAAPTTRASQPARLYRSSSQPFTTR